MVAAVNVLVPMFLRFTCTEADEPLQAVAFEIPLILASKAIVWNSSAPISGFAVEPGHEPLGHLGSLSISVLTSELAIPELSMAPWLLCKSLLLEPDALAQL